MNLLLCVENEWIVPKALVTPLKKVTQKFLISGGLIVKEPGELRIIINSLVIFLVGIIAFLEKKPSLIAINGVLLKN